MARNAGCRQVDVADTGRFLVLPMAMLYPTRAPAAPLRFGPYPLSGVPGPGAPGAHEDHMGSRPICAILPDRQLVSC